jgi:serine/threonine protein kinase
LIVRSIEDDRVLGYLLKYYPNGNLRDYSIQNRKSLSNETLCKWSTQIAGVLRHLLFECDFTYVDIKPDNILVDENEANLVLADFSDEGCTSWIASPELFHGHDFKQSSIVNGKERLEYANSEPANTTLVPRHSSIPDEWPRLARDKVMVYSVGRTLWMIWEAIPAEKFTMADFNRGSDFDSMRMVFTKSTDSVPSEMKDLVLRCVEEDPNARPTLAEVEAFFSNVKV